VFKPSTKSKPDPKRVPQRDPNVPRITGPQITHSKFVEGDPDWESPADQPTPRVESKAPKDQPGYAGKCFNGRWTVEEYERRLANQLPRATRGRFMQGLDYHRYQDL
jgi:hypothetical protein